ncbi:C1 family peptidase [Bacteriovorax sp. PP10]|uniref:C1 family peptidase n=1 Tax=Bacteriovorax antarcticus TaxID=3088717 RepID=A0ABU5VYE0_9BACT|nr:C1 family peptidase [Bacteriovorax sp. PP10]MEA9357972.1 C1 family peptidase [Bacteriovorax sp. PP10]
MKKWIVLAVLALNVSAQASSISVNSINSLIQKNKGGWIARENRISRLSDFEIKRLLGSKDLPEGNGLYEDRTRALEAWDWRNVEGVNWLGSVMDQGNCGSCVAFASVATLEAQYRINSTLPWLTPTFSPQQLFNCGGGACDMGWFPSSAASFLKNKGVVDSSCAPYASGSTGEDVQCKKNFCQNQTERTYRIANFNSPSGGGGVSSKVKEALKKGPLVTTLTVYEDFMVYSSGVYKSVSNKRVGGHAVSLVGFNDEGRYWIVRNSWGPDWGENGFIRVSYDDKSGIGDSTWAYQTTPEDNYISIANPTDHQYVSGTETIQVKLAKPAASEVVIAGDTDTMNVVSCQGTSTQECGMTIDTQKLKDGRYEVYAKSGDKKSQVREFLVVNHEPQTTISFAGVRGVDLKKPQKGRIEFDIDVKAAPVIPQRVTFIIEDSTGKVIVKRVTDQVVEHMRLGFRTNTIANGSYKIYYTAETPFNGSMAEARSNVEVMTTKN